MGAIGVISWRGAAEPFGYVVGDSPTSGRSLAEAASLFRERGVSVVAIGGNDASQHRALSALGTAFAGGPLPAIAIVGAGRDLLSLNLRLRGGASTLAALVEAQSAGVELPSVEVDTLELEGRLGFVFGTGLAVGFVEEVRRRKAVGRLSLAFELARVVASAAIGGETVRRLHDRRRCRVEADGEVWSKERFSGLLAGTLRRLPLGFSPLHRAGELPRTFHLVGLAATPAALPGELARLGSGLPLSPGRSIDAVARQVILTSDRPFRYLLDGVPYDAGEVLRLTVGPRLRIIVQ